MVDSSVALAREIRMNVLKMVHSVNASHVGSCFSITDILAVLYDGVLNIRPLDPCWSNRDRMILSKGHSCAAVYAALALKGFFPLSELETYGKDGARLMAHISHKVPGVEFSTGSLGHGLSFAVGKALAAKRQGLNWRVYALLSDGEMDEGSNWEALLFAAHHKLDNLTLIIDYNKLQSLTTVAETLGLEPLVSKLAAFGWSVREVDGHNHSVLYTAFQSSSCVSDKPTVLIAHTIKGKGVSFMENKVEWHYRSPNTEQLSLALLEVESSHA